ncbi:MAG: lytic transglycosylase domain-containing protein [Chloroflexi bacterium]|nr:lytic transglycosylase domain-containing protein [Chloroflexota bacterium]
MLLTVVLLTGAALLAYRYSDSLRSPRGLYEAAQKAAPARAARLYDLLARRLPEIEEYCRLWSAEARMPSIVAVADLHAVARYRPDSPTAYAAHLALARYYASIESPNTVDAYRAALGVDGRVEARLELARYLEQQGALAGAYQQYLAMMGPDRRDAFADARRTAPDALTAANDLLARGYVTDALDALQADDGCEAHCLRARILRRLSRDASAREEERLCDACRPAPTPSPAPTPTAQPTAEPEAEPSREETSEAPPFACEGALDAWRDTWELEETANVNEAVAMYLRIAACDTYVADDAAYRAWVLARREHDALSEAAALALLEAQGPSWLAARALGALSLEMAPPFPAQALEALAGEVLRKVAALEALGLDELAFQELRLTALVSETPEVIYRMAYELAARGHVVASVSLAFAYLADQPYAPQEFWELAYPRAYADEVAASAEAYNLEPELLWAMMRQESLFKPDVVSSAGARGPMQLMRELQEDCCTRAGIACTPGDAYLPASNIACVSWGIRSYLDYYEGDEVSMILAFNAGPGNVDRWLSDPMIADEDDLIRFAWFGETREYLERVQLDRLIYRELYR